MLLWELTCSAGMGLVLSPTDKGIFVKGFSKGESVARNTGQIEIGDHFFAIDGNQINTVQDAKHYLSLVCVVSNYDCIEQKIYSIIQEIKAV